MTASTSPPPPMTGARLLAQALHRYGVRDVFHIPGEGILEIVDALADLPDLTLTTCRHEAGMAYAAQAHGRLSGRPGVCLAARAPGALNAALALHTADTDAAPLVMIVGQAPLDEAGRDPLSGPDLGEVFAPMAKAVLLLTDAARVGELLHRAWHTAASGRMGPVVVLAPEDVMRQPVDAPAALPEPPACAPAAPGAAARAAWQAFVAQARRPLLVVGGSGWQAEDHDALARFLAHGGWPVVCAYRRADLVDHDHGQFAGELGIGIDPALAAAVDEADLVVAVNVRLGEINTFGAGGFGGYRLLGAPRPKPSLVHVHAALDELQRTYHAGLAVAASPGEFLRMACERPLPAIEAGWLPRLRTARERFTGSGGCPGPLDLRETMQALRRLLPPQAPVCVGAGAYATWLHRYFALHRPGTLLGPKSGAMGYGLAAAIGAARARPGLPVVALAGDGCLQMHGEELATAVQYALPIVLVVVNNAAYAAIEGAQQRLFGRATGTRLQRVDFAAWARSQGAGGESVHTTDGAAPALQRAIAHALAGHGPQLVELVVPDALGKPQ